MKKALLWILSIVTILSAICMPVVADDYEGHEAIGGETVTVVFKSPDEMEYTNIKSGALEYSFDDTLDHKKPLPVFLYSPKALGFFNKI